MTTRKKKRQGARVGLPAVHASPVRENRSDDERQDEQEDDDLHPPFPPDIPGRENASWTVPAGEATEKENDDLSWASLCEYKELVGATPPPQFRTVILGG